MFDHCLLDCVAIDDQNSNMIHEIIDMCKGDFMINMDIYIIKISKTFIAYFNLYNGFILTIQIIKSSNLMTNKRDIYVKFF